MNKDMWSDLTGIVVCCIVVACCVFSLRSCREHFKECGVACGSIAKVAHSNVNDCRCVKDK